MRRVTLLTIVFAIVLMLNGFAQKGYVNPAAKYCEILGYKYQITSVKGMGEVGMALLPDGRLVNAWDFYKGKVAQEYSYASKYGYTIITEISKVNGFTMESPVCVKTVKGIQEKIALVDLMEKNGDFLYVEKPGMIDYHDFAKVDPNFQVIDAVPTSFDWRSYNGHSYIGSPRDQGSCGSCYAFGATACAEGTYNFATGKYDGNTSDFAESYIIWCLSQLSAYSGHFGGCDGADYDYQELQALVDVGTIPESYFPYSPSTGQTCPTSTASAPKTKFLGWYRVACSDVNAIKTAIMTYGVVDAAVNVTTNFQNYSGGVFTDTQTSCTGSPCYNTTTNHAISLVGWGTDATYGDYWILRNSWGSSWGESGYMKLSVSSARILCSVCYMTYQGSTTTTPTVSTNSVSSITNTTAVCGGNITANGGATVTASGVVYAKTSNPTITTGTIVSTSPVVTSGTYTSNLTGLTAGTTYYVRAFATNSNGTAYGAEQTFTTTGTPPITYCSSMGSNYSYEWISKVVIGSFTNSSTAAGYTDFTSKTITVNTGTTAITLTPGFASTTYNEYWKIWADLNKDGDFEDTGELIFDAGSMSKTAVTGNITIPTSAAGVTTRLRVSMKYNASQTSCETFSYGEVEDYTVTIQTGTVVAPVANFSASATTITAGQSVTFTDLSTNTPTSWSWTFTGGTPSTSTAQNPTVTYSTAGTYQVSLTATNSAGSNTKTVASYITVNPIVITYCTTKGTNCSEEWIAKVQLGSFTKTSTGTSYSDFTSSVIPVVAGSNSVTLTPGFSGSTYTEYFRVWIDFNKDGDFVDSGEQVFAPSGSKTAVTGTITIPTSFSGTTRMRVSMKYGAAPTSCETFSYGEVEDYTVSLNKASIMQENNMSFNIYPNPANDIVYISSGELGAEMKIFNSMGELVDLKTITDNTQSLNISSYPKGVYLVYIINKNSVVKTAKFIKQ